MRRQFFALESASPASAPIRMLSLEEEMVMVDEAADEAAAIERDLTESERVIEVSDALEDVAVVADGIEAATPGEVALIDTASQMAVAGTDIEPEEIVPAMESYMGKRISTESIRETARTIWENIQAFLTKVWNNIVAYFRIAAVVPMLEKRIEAMEKKIGDLGKLKEGAGPIKLKSSFLAIDGKVVKSGAELKKGFALNVATAKYVFGENADKVAANGEALAKVIEKFTPEKHAEVMSELIAEFGKLSYPSIPEGKKGKDTGTSESGTYEVTEGPGLLGGGHLVLREYKKLNTPDGSPLGTLERFRKSGLTIETGNEPAPAETEFTALTVAEMGELLSDAKELLKQLKEFHGGARLNKLKKAGDALKAASKKATGEMSKIKQDDKGTAGVVNDYRSMLNLNGAFARWVQSPALPFYGKSISTVKAVMMAVGSSAAQYESKEAAAAEGKK